MPGKRPSRRKASGAKAKPIRRRRATYSRYRRTRYAPRAGNFLSSKRYCVTKYIVDIPWAVTGYAIHTFRASSIWDPDYTGTGSSVIGYDQMQNMYERYLVYSATFYVTIQNLNADQVCKVVLLATDATNAGSPTTIYDAAAQPRSRSRDVGPKGSSNDRIHMKYTVSTRAIVGTKDVLDSSRYWSAINDNPTAPAYFHILIDNRSVTTDSDLLVNVTMYQKTLLLQPKTVDF